MNLVRRGDPLPAAASGSRMEGLLRLDARLDGWEREHLFAPERRWRLDFAWPHKRVGVELDGLVHSGRGCHQTVDGILAR